MHVDRLPTPKSLPKVSADWEIEKELNTRAVTFDQLVIEIRGIYAALVKAEDACIKEVSDSDKEGVTFTDDRWKSLVELHRVTLFEFCDFFFAVNHPVAAASDKLKNVVTKYSMPARLWRHAIYRLLDLMRRNLPSSQPHMLRFISLGFNMITVLYENSRDLCDVWAECLGDIARFRMAVESESVDTRSLWIEVSRYWYQRSIDLTPGIGQRYHHIAILSRPSLLGQLLFFTKSLCTRTPFPTTKETIMTLFTQVAQEKTEGSPALEIALVKTYSALIQDGSDEEFESSLQEFLMELERSSGPENELKQFSYRLAIINIHGLLTFCSPQNPLTSTLVNIPSPPGSPSLPIEQSLEAHSRASNRAVGIAAGCLSAILHHRSAATPPASPYLHVMLAFLASVAQQSNSGSLPITSLYSQLNRGLLTKTLGEMSERLLSSRKEYAGVLSGNTLPCIELRDQGGCVVQPLPEDYFIRGSVWEELYFPNTWFDNDTRDYDERVTVEAEWMDAQRDIRCVWLGARLLPKIGW